MPAPLTVLYDGWPLVYEPDRPAALHLHALLSQLPPSIHAVLAYPAAPGTDLQLPAAVQIETVHTQDTPRARLPWEQRRLPALARQSGAHLVHLTHAHPALLAGPRTVISPTSPLGARERGSGLPSRLRAALSAGGMARAGGLLWPQDLPAPAGFRRVIDLPPYVHPAFAPPVPGASPMPGSITLPETFILYHGPYDVPSLERLLVAWTWGAGALGELYPLVLLGAGQAGRTQALGLAKAYEVEDALQILPAVPLADIPTIYKASAALFHPAPIEPWGGAVRHALACGIPVVALESPLADALVGEAAYLIAPGDTRALGAALITVIVEPEVADRLASAALERSATWRDPSFGAALLAAYRQALGQGNH